MKKNTKHFLSFCSLIVFAVFAVSSAGFKGAPGSYGVFKSSNYVEDSTDNRNYILMNDNSKVYGDKIVAKGSGILTKEHITMDGQRYKMVDVKGYREKGTFFGRLDGKNNSYLARVVHGKINVYIDFETHTSISSDKYGVHQTEHTVEVFYFQRGEDDHLKRIGSPEIIQTLVKDCPAASEMIAGKTNKELRKLVRKDRNYLNEIIETYNNDCKLTLRPGKKKK